MLQSMGSQRVRQDLVVEQKQQRQCGILVPDQGLNPYPLHWKVESLPMDHWGTPKKSLFNLIVFPW